MSRQRDEGRPQGCWLPSLSQLARMCMETQLRHLIIPNNTLVPARACTSAREGGQAALITTQAAADQVHAWGFSKAAQQQSMTWCDPASRPPPQLLAPAGFRHCASCLVQSSCCRVTKNALLPWRQPCPLKPFPHLQVSPVCVLCEAEAGKPWRDMSKEERLGFKQEGRTFTCRGCRTPKRTPSIVSTVSCLPCCEALPSCTWHLDDTRRRVVRMRWAVKIDIALTSTPALSSCIVAVPRVSLDP